MSDFSTDDKLFMNLAISMARKCTPDDPNNTPMVGAVIANNDRLPAATFRGEKDHAEKLALSEIPSGELLTDASVYTTLEPCTHHVRRKPGDSCTERLISVHPKKVFVGMLDPNQGVCGRGVSALQLASIEVVLFPHILAEEIKNMNNKFIVEQQGLGIEINVPINSLSVPPGIMQLSGPLINEPGERGAFVLVRKGGEWWPQGQIIVEGKTWRASADLGQSEGRVDVQIVKANDLGSSLIHYYYKVGTKHKEARQDNNVNLPFSDYFSIEMNSLPKGIDLQASVEVFVSKNPAEDNEKRLGK